MGVHEYRGEPGMGYLYLATAAGTAPHTGLKPGDRIDFGDNKPPADGRWFEAAADATATRLPDNHPDAQPVVQWPEPEPDDEKPMEDSTPEPGSGPTDTTPAEPAKRSKPATKTAA